MARDLPSLPALVGIGLVAGFFSALFGVGGGIIVVPLLILAGLAAKEATATSLAVIGFTAVFGVVAFTALGHVDWDGAALVGLPAMAGTILGTWAQQRISSRLLVVLFALFIIAVAIELFIS